MSDDYAELKAQIFAAREIIGHLCAEGRPPRMSIPANRHTDEDMVMDAALAAADKAIDTLRAENERLRRRLSEIDAALYLASEDVLWFHSKEDEGADLERWLVGVINCNDAFYYATADGEAIAPGEFLLARDVYDTYGYHGLIALAALRRKKEPLEPLRTPEYYAALKSLQTDAAVEGER